MLWGDIMLKKASLGMFIFIFLFTMLFSSNKNPTNSFLYPTNARYISSYYGYREIFGSISFHNGIDFPLVCGSNVYSSLSGTIIHTGFLTGYGNTVIILHDNGYKTLYSHLSSEYIVKTGQYVNSSELIATVGPKYLEGGILNGYTTGPHLHFSVFKPDGSTIDPLTILSDN